MFTKRNPVRETKKEGGETKHNVTDGNERRAAGWRFFLWWIFASLGFPLGGVLALVLVGPVEGQRPVL